MGLNRIYKITGYLSLAVGLIATLCLFKKMLSVALGLSLLGMIFAIANIFLNAKYFEEDEKMPRGYFGLFLSSLPVVFVMMLVFKAKS